MKLYKNDLMKLCEKVLADQLRQAKIDALEKVFHRLRNTQTIGSASSEMIAIKRIFQDELKELEKERDA